MKDYREIISLRELREHFFQKDGRFVSPYPWEMDSVYSTFEEALDARANRYERKLGSESIQLQYVAVDAEEFANVHPEWRDVLVSYGMLKKVQP